MKTDPNETAFAMAATEWDKAQAGLTKREYFPAMAMQGLLSAGETRDVAAMAVEYTEQLIKALGAQGD